MLFDTLPDHFRDKVSKTINKQQGYKGLLIHFLRRSGKHFPLKTTKVSSLVNPQQVYMEHPILFIYPQIPFAIRPPTINERQGL